MKNFLANWRHFTSGTEAPEAYYLWSGISALASVIGRRVWIRYGRFTFVPHVYIVLLGPPGNGKTTGMSMAKTLIRDLGVPFSAESQTKESLVKEWKENERQFEVDGKKHVYTPISIFVTELSHFLGTSNSGHMIDFLTTAYDSTDIYDCKTKNKGNDIIYGPCINLLGCTTPDWITTYLKTDIISGGFTRRVIFINEYESKDRIPFPSTTQLQVESGIAATKYLMSMKEVAGEFKWDNSAIEFFTKWYINRTFPTDPTIRAFVKCMHVPVIKVAMLIALSESFDLVLTAEHLKITLALFDDVIANLPKVFQGMGRNELNAVATKILDLLSMNNGSLAEKEVMRAMSRDANGQELFNTIGFMERTDQVVRMKENRGGIERVIIATPEFAAKHKKQQ